MFSNFFSFYAIYQWKKFCLSLWMLGLNVMSFRFLMRQLKNVAYEVKIASGRGGKCRCAFLWSQFKILKYFDMIFLIFWCLPYRNLGCFFRREVTVCYGFIKKAPRKLKAFWSGVRSFVSGPHASLGLRMIGGISAWESARVLNFTERSRASLSEVVHRSLFRWLSWLFSRRVRCLWRWFSSKYPSLCLVQFSLRCGWSLFVLRSVCAVRIASSRLLLWLRRCPP